MVLSWKKFSGQIILLSLLILTEFSQGQPSTTTAPLSPVLPYVSLGATDGVEREYIGHFDDGVSHAIHIPDGFPFGNFLHSSVYIGTNGIFSFSEPFYSAVARAFPSTLSTVATAYLVAPYWDDVDIRLAGNISYEVHSRSDNNPGSNQLLDQISQFIEDSTSDSFQGDWMLVAEWEEVHPWPHGLDNPIFELFFPELVFNNTWQGLVITDGVISYTVFTYRCGDMNWAYGPTIGFNAAGDYYVNHPNTGSTNGEEIACLNSPDSQWYNLVYEISHPNATNQTLELPTVEPPQGSYLSFLEFTNDTATSGTLPPCQNCTVAITIPGNGFPFGSYYHTTLYVGTNGIFSFGRDFRQDFPEAFPSTDAEIYFAYLVAPYWSNIDTRLDGQVNYEVHVMGESATSNDYLGRVSSLINSETQDPDFTGNWMIAVTWDGVHPFPHGNSAEQDRVDPYLQSVNTFQGILITNGTKSYSVFTYECDQMEWSDAATIGYNAGGEYNASHPLSGTLLANAVDCLHSNINVAVNNIIFDLVPGELNAGTTPPPPSSLGSCVAAGYSDCCETGLCFGDLLDCFCDEFCYNFDDCCSDITDICSIEAPLGNDTYLVFGSVQLLNRVSLTGSDLHVLVHQPNTAVLGVDFDYQRGYLYWSEGIGDVIYRSAMDGSNIEVLLNTSTEVVDDIAMDWIGNNLYWTDAFYARIEVMDMDTGHRMELMRTGANTIPRAIAVDPSTGWMYWTDWGDEARIERASMDGSDRRVLHNTDLTWPNGLTIDYPAQRIYWVDAFRDMIEYSNVDGSGRFVLASNLDHPFSITLEGNLLFWTDWLTNAIHVTHKISSTGVSFVYNNLRDRPFGIEAVTPTRQAQNITNPCDGTSCTFMCLLSATDPNGYSCACPDGYELSSDNTDCTFVGFPPPSTAVGSCADAGYQNCCIAGYCAGSPPTCSCDLGCYLRGDCCPDANMSCPRGSCAAAGYRACCTDGSLCQGSAGCYCDFACTFFGDCCFDFEDLCPTDLGSVIGSCAAAGYTTCCDDGSECLGTPTNCKCDAECRDHGDCCADIGSSCPVLPSGNFTVQMTWLPYLTLRSTPGVVTNSLPSIDDGASPVIPIPTGFPIGNSNQSVAYISTNGMISFQQPFTFHIPSLFPSSLTSSAYLLAPFWSDVDISIYGSIFYEVHSDSGSLLIQQVNNFISNQTETDFNGTWMLVVQWDEVHQFPGFLTIPTNTYQAIAITDGSQSYAVYTYRCGDLGWPGGATIGYNGGPIGNFHENHPLSGANANSIACLNTGVTEWSNVIYNVSIDTYIYTGPPPAESGLPYLSLGTTDGVEREYVGHFDDGVSHAIHIPDGFPFGNFIHSSVYIGTNGIFSFSEPFYSAVARAFPSTLSTVATAYLVAPYWDDVDIRLAGNISYEVHSRSDNNPGSNQLLDQISQFIEDSTSDPFQGNWMLVAEWEEVHPWPHGLDNPIFELFFPELVLNNTWQGLVITDGVTSYAVFTYRCGDMNWAYGPTIGFNAAGDYYVNHPNTGSRNGEEIACLNSPDSQWYNLVYEVSNPNATNQTLELPTVEPPQGSYLSFLAFTNDTATSGTLPPCQNCTIAITIPGNGFPFGSYYHSSVYVGTNGIFSFGRDFRQDFPEAFPSTDAEIYFAYLVAPYWSNIDTRLDGQVNYEVHVMGESTTSDDYLGRVSSLINLEAQDPDFTGNWMIAVTWDGVHPFPHGNSAEQDRVDPYLQSVNTFQGVLITNGTKSYSVFTYECDQMEWSDAATIGYNAGGEYNASHPLSGTLLANAVDCLHSNINVTLNNIIFDLVPGELNAGTTPPPPSSLGSCVAAGYSDCCEDGFCLGDIFDCFCDEFCYNFDDCCSDLPNICSIEAPLGNDTYLVFGSLQLLSRVGLTGNDLHVLVHQDNAAVLGVDFDYRRGYLYWSEGIGDVMYRSAMDGSNIEVLLNTSTEVVDDIAMDWIGNNLYWTDAFYARIEVMDMDTGHRMELMRTGVNTIPRAIAVDPSTRFMYWTDWGDEARIERASMDGSDRRVLHNTDLTWPNGLTIDYPAQRIYWVDAFRDMIEYSNVDGSGRFLLASNLDHPFSITLEDNLLFWTDWLTNAIHVTHKISSTGVSFVYNNLRDRPFGIEAVTPTRQALNITNPCDGTSCTFMCLLSAIDPNGYSCACPDGYELSSDNTDCTFVGFPPPSTAVGSCADAGYQNCCIAGYCAGSPPTCACDLGCYLRGDCCPDTNISCPAGSCAAAGYRACCTDGSLCQGSAGCYCDFACTFFGDCCFDFEDLCPTDLGSVIGSCAAAGYTTCCDDGSECLGTPTNCKCDAECRDHGDCCADIALTCPFTPINHTVQMTWLPYLTLRITPGVVTNSVPEFDDGTSVAIPIPTGFPIGNTNQSVAYVGTNGLISFQQPFTHHIPSLFPSEFTFISSAFILAPFWSDVDIRVFGSIFYEVHSGSDSLLIQQVNEFISNQTESDFTGTWMLVVQWDEVHQFPGILTIPTNTYQGIAITDGSQSHAVYTYRCGDLGWPGGATIGYNGGEVGDFYENHPLSGANANSIACLNTNVTEWSNVIYNVSIDTYIPTDPPPTVEPPQDVYLEFLERTDNSITMRRCDDCSSDAIDLSANPVPFGDYYHYVAHITSNGLISFGQQFPNFGATLFPNEADSTVFTAFLAAPYWADIDNRILGEIWYETHTTGQSATSDSLLERVSNLVRSEQNVTSFQGNWMVVATWNESIPFAGTGVQTNTFQGIVITDGNKTYAVYTYHCDDVEWSDGSVIGFNAGGSYYANHPLSDSLAARDIDCVHSPESEWNNVVYDVNPNGTTIYGPPVLSGSCAEAGYTECCTGSSCAGQPVEDCYCDSGCRAFGDCCSDIDDICPLGVTPSGNSLIVANSYQILHIGIDGGAGIPIIPFNFGSYFVGLDIDYRQSYVYYADVIADVISRVYINGSSPETLLTLQYEYIEDLAVDWIANNLYWTDGLYNRLEVLDLDTLSRAELLRTGPHTAPRAIVVDPSTRYMYWTDWGEPAKIERASMDGSNREVLHNTGLTWPNGLAIDYELQRLYWADAFTDRIEYSSVNGVGREILLTVVTGLHHPFSVTISGDQVYWTDWSNFTVYTAHKQSAISILPVYEDFFFLPNGIEAVDPTRQQTNITNYCEGNTCSHLCLLSASSPMNYTCACPQGSSLLQDGLTCTEVSNVTVGPPPQGSCAAAGYTGCCDGGYCAGSPPTCFCEPDCQFFLDCCDDFVALCLNATTPPRPPLTTQTPPLTTRPTSQPTTAPRTTTNQATSRTTPPNTTPAQPTTTQTTGTTMAQPQTTQPTGAPPTTPQLGAPSSVVGLSAVAPDGSNTTLTVTWMTPSQPSGPGAVSLYFIIVTNYSLNSVASKTVSGDTTSTNVTGLGPFIPYYVTVIASNAFGNSTETSILRFTEEGVPPVPPSNIKAELDSNTKLTVTWDLLTPEEAWGNVTSYTVSYKKATEPGNGKEKTVSDTDNSLQIGDLEPDENYIIVMWANTTAGMGQNSKALEVSTKTPTGSAGSTSISGGGIAGILIAVIAGLVILVLVVLIAAWMFRKYKKKTVRDYDVFFSDASSLNSSISGDFRPRLDSYQSKFGKKKKAEAKGKVKPTSYRPMGEMTSFENPVYESNPEVFALPGVASYGDRPSNDYEDLSGSIGEKVDLSEVKL